MGQAFPHIVWRDMGSGRRGSWYSCNTHCVHCTGLLVYHSRGPMSIRVDLLNTKSI